MLFRSEVVSIYRRALDAYADNPTGWSVPDEVDARLRQAFNREFTAGLLLGENGRAFYNPERPGNQGLSVGKVAAVVGDRVRVTLARPVRAGDVLAFMSGGKEIVNTLAHAAGQTLEIKSDAARSLRPGERLVRLFDSSRSAALRAQYQAYATSPLPLAWHVTGKHGTALTLCLQQGGASVRVQSDLLLDHAQGEGLTLEGLSRQLSKLGDTPFVQAGMTADLPPRLFLPVSEINACRRRAVSAMIDTLFGQSDPVVLPPAMPALGRAPGKQTGGCLGVTVCSSDEALAAARSGAEWLAVGREWVETDLPQLLAVYRSVRADVDIPVALRLPRVLHTDEEEWVLSRLDGSEEIIASAPGILHAAASKGCVVRGDSGLNVFNSLTPTALPLASATLSPELNRGEVMAVLANSAVPLEIAVHERTLLMVHENCILGGGGCTRGRGCHHHDMLLDRKGLNFPVYTDYRCRSYLLNAHTTSLIGHLADMVSGGASRLRLELAGEGSEVVAQAVALYKSSLERRSNDQAASAREQVTELFGELTRGHWQRGVG